MPKFVRSDPRDESVNPKKLTAADGKTPLYRYRIDAVVYAPNLEEARQRVEHMIYVDAARVERG